MRSIEVKTIPVKTLRRHLELGRFAVPRLQREFVWNGKKAAMLFDSIYRRMPIGSLLVWKTGRNNESLLRKAMHILPPYDRTNPHIWFLIDGQQRLSVLYQCMSGGDPKINADDKEVDFSKVTFAVNGVADGGIQFAYRTPVDGEFVSVRAILAPNWRQKLARLPKYKLDRLAKCRAAVLTYPLPVIFTQTTNIEDVKQLFIRINSAGTPIRAADRTFTEISDIDLREMAHELRDQLQVGGFRRVPPETVLQGFALALDPKSQDVGERAYRSTLRAWEKEAMVDDAATKRAYAEWDRYKRACGLAVDYLRMTFCLRDAEFLPSTNMLATLAVFFFHHPSQPHSAQRREIRKWFWATGVGKRYSGRGYRENIIADSALFRRLARTGHGRFAFPQRVPHSEVRAAQYGQRSSVTNAFYCLLANLEPCYFKNGEPLPVDLYAVRANRKNRHHIFPQTLASNSGLVPSQYNSICNICFLDEQTNQEIGAKSPRVYLTEWRNRRFFARAMRSHRIPYERSSPLWLRGVKRAYPRFVKARLALLCREFEKQAGIKLFQKD